MRMRRTDWREWQKGDQVYYEDIRDGMLAATVIGRDTKDGRTVIDVRTEDGRLRWGYEDQITTR